MYATTNSFEFPHDERIAHIKELPPLLRFYIKMGVEVSSNGYIDYSFNSCDVITMVDMTKANQAFVNYDTRKLERCE